MAELSIPFRCTVCGQTLRIPLSKLRVVPVCHGQPMQLSGDQDVQQAVDAIFRGVSNLVVAALRNDEASES